MPGFARAPSKNYENCPKGSFGENFLFFGALNSKCRALPVHPRKITKIVRRAPLEKIFYFSGL